MRVSCPGRVYVERLARAERDPGPSATKSRSAIPLVSPLSGPAELLAALGPGHERAKSRRAKRTVGRRHHSRCQTAQCSSFPRRVAAPGFSLFLSRPPPTRGGRSADRRTISVVAFARRDWSARVRRGASHDAGRSPLGAPPWRFSAGGRASISGIASGSVQRAPRSQVVMPGGRCPGPPEPAVTSRGRRTPLPAPPFRIVSGRRPSMSEDANRIL